MMNYCSIMKDEALQASAGKVCHLYRYQPVKIMKRMKAIRHLMTLVLLAQGPLKVQHKQKMDLCSFGTYYYINHLQECSEQKYHNVKHFFSLLLKAFW